MASFPLLFGGLAANFISQADETEKILKLLNHVSYFPLSYKFYNFLAKEPDD